MESSDDRSYLQVHLWRSTSRKMTYPLFLFATFYMSGAVWASLTGGGEGEGQVQGNGILNQNTKSLLGIIWLLIGWINL